MTIRALTSLAAAGAATVALAACGDDGGARNEGSARDRAQEGALQWARCMRKNGVDVPDPSVGENGLVRVGPGPGAGRAEGGGIPNPESPRFARAGQACRKHLEAGAPAPDDATTAKHRDAFVAYARCMRREGVDVPDPGPQGGMVFKAGDPNAVDPRSPAFRRADEVCHEHLAAVDREVQKEGGE